MDNIHIEKFRAVVEEEKLHVAELQVIVDKARADVDAARKPYVAHVRILSSLDSSGMRRVYGVVLFLWVLGAFTLCVGIYSVFNSKEFFALVAASLLILLFAVGMTCVAYEDSVHIRLSRAAADVSAKALRDLVLPSGWDYFTKEVLGQDTDWLCAMRK